MRPLITLPRGSAMTIFSNVCPSPISRGVPDSDGRRWPYWTETKPPFAALSV